MRPNIGRTMFIATDSMNIVAGFLPMVDIVRLRWISKDWRDAILVELHFRRRLIKLLACRMDADPMPMLAACARHRAVISGSVILEVMYDTEFNDADIDVFGAFPTNAAMVAAVNDIAGLDKKEVLNSEEYSDAVGDMYADVDYDSMEPPPSPVMHRQNVAAGAYLIHSHGRSLATDGKYRKLQIIETYGSTPLDLVGRFDLSVVMNAYVGRKLEMAYPHHVLGMESIYFRTNCVGCRPNKYRGRGIEVRSLRRHFILHRMRMEMVFVALGKKLVK